VGKPIPLKKGLTQMVLPLNLNLIGNGKPHPFQKGIDTSRTGKLNSFSLTIVGNPIHFKRGLIFPIRGFRDYKFGLGVGSPFPSKRD